MKEDTEHNSETIGETEQLKREIEDLRAALSDKEKILFALEISKARYCQVVETSPNAILTVNRQGQIQYWNESCERLTGFSLVIGQNLRSLVVSTDEANRFDEIIAGVFTGKSYTNVTFSLRRSDGSSIKMISRAYPVIDRQGEVIECVLANTDTGRSSESGEDLKRAHEELERRVNERTLELVSVNVSLKKEIAVRQRFEDKLKESEERYRSLIQNSTTGVYIYQDKAFAYVNDRLASMLGYKPEQIIGHSYRDFVHRDDFYLIRQIAKTVDLGQPNESHYEFRAVHKDGKTLWLEIFFGLVQYMGRLAAMGNVLDITARKQAELALQDSEERYRAIFENAEDIIFIKDTNFKYVNMNPAMEKFLELPASEITGKSDDSLYGETEGLRTRDIDKRVLAGETVREEQTKTVKGSVRTFHVLKTPLRAASGENIGILGIARDVSDRKKAEEALRNQEQMLKMTLSASPVAISYIEDGRLKWTNQAMAQMFGYNNEDEYIGKKAKDFYASEDEYSRVRRIFQQAVSQGETVETEARFRCYDGSIFIGQLKITALDASNLKKGTISSIADISDRKRAQEALRKSRARYRVLFEQWQRIAELYRTLLDASPDPIVVYDIDGNPTYLNSAFTKVFGWAIEEVQGKRIDYVPQDNWPETNRMINDALHGRSFSNVETKRYVKGGKIIDVSISGAGYFDEHGNVAGSVIQLRDITEYKHMEEQLRHAAKMEAIGKLAGGVAHDFNNLLTAMMGYSQMLMRQLPEDGPHQDTLTRIIRATERAAEVTRQLLAFGRKQLLEVRIINLNSLILDLKHMLEELMGEHIDLKTSLEGDLGCVKADPGQIEQIILNLVVNARDAMPSGGSLSIETSNVTLGNQIAPNDGNSITGPHVMLAVSDTGLGMDPETVLKIFDPFFTTKDKGVGTGLGLSTVYGIVKQHNGQIIVDSEPDKGTIFRIFLPRIEDQVEPTQESILFRPQPRGTETILVVEDEAIVRDLACEILGMLGYKTLMACDPQEALELCRSHADHIDLVLTDVVLPKMDGKSLFDKIASFRPGIKALFMSGYTDNAIGRHGVLEQGMHFMPKPFSVDTLAQKVREVLDLHP